MMMMTIHGTIDSRTVFDRSSSNKFFPRMMTEMIMSPIYVRRTASDGKVHRTIVSSRGLLRAKKFQNKSSKNKTMKVEWTWTQLIHLIHFRFFFVLSSSIILVFSFLNNDEKCSRTFVLMYNLLYLYITMVTFKITIINTVTRARVT